jgi:voltage-gated potassium channel
MSEQLAEKTLKQTLYEVIFGTDTPAGRRFDLILITAIVASVMAVMIDTVEWLSLGHHSALLTAEWIFTAIFTFEYLVRIYCSPQPFRYMRSFYGIVDLFSILPTYLMLIYPDIGFLLVIRLLRVLRIFRILKLVRYLSEMNILMRAMLQARRKILIFFTAVLVLSAIFGSLMYIVEGPGNGFSSIPKSIYWTIVTITTVGYGDITPQTPFGQVIAAVAMLTGYSIIAVPTGILTAELSQEMFRERADKRCGACEKPGHDNDADFCKFCGAPIS